MPLRKPILFFLSVLLLLLPLTVPAQQGRSALPVTVDVRLERIGDDAGLILYDAGHKLSIRDFKGPPDEASEGVGATYSGIRLSMEGKSSDGKMLVKVRMMVYFDPSASWMKPEGKNDRVLKHEQIHFDLTAIYACKMYHAIVEGRFNSRNVKQKLRDLQEHYTNLLQAQQQRYDKETRHGTIADRQQAWAERVADMRSELDCM